MSRNQVFIRDERVGGAETCDDTMSAVVEALFGKKSPAIAQPSRYRDGYDEGGKQL